MGKINNFYQGAADAYEPTAFPYVEKIKVSPSTTVYKAMEKSKPESETIPQKSSDDELIKSLDAENELQQKFGRRL